jgi:K+-sensing histidine kinase KdpD
MSESQQGVGLGLAISRELARAMGGELSATSILAEGTVFTLSFPCLSQTNTGSPESSLTVAGAVASDGRDQPA